jgi:xanthine dehydrogenase accessory factor
VWAIPEREPTLAYVYEIAQRVIDDLRAGTRVDVAWAVETHGFSSRDPSEALAITPGRGRVGGVLSGSLDDQLTDFAEQGATGRLIELQVSERDATAVGLECGGSARCLLITAADLPSELWDRLRDREPICLVTRVDGPQVLDTTMFTMTTIADANADTAQLFRRGVSTTVASPDSVVTVLWPVPMLLIIGAGAIADALAAAAGLLGWHTQAVTQASAATEAIAGSGALDKVVVISHDDEVGGPALASALASDVGYIGALGSRRTQQSRADWLAAHGVTNLDRVHGPAGLSIGADTPAEIAVSILAEALAVRTGTSVGSLRDRSGSIH